MCVFQLCGIALFVLGLVFRFGGSELKEDIKPALADIEVSGHDLYAAFNALAIIFIVAGAVVIVFSIIGFIGACCFVKIALIAVSKLWIIVLINCNTLNHST